MKQENGVTLVMIVWGILLFVLIGPVMADYGRGSTIVREWTSIDGSTYESEVCFGDIENQAGDGIFVSTVEVEEVNFVGARHRWSIDPVWLAAHTVSTVYTDLPVTGDGTAVSPIDIDSSIAGYGLTMTTNYIDVEAGYGLDTTADSVLLDPTEVDTTTWGSGLGFIWTFDASAGTDPTLTFDDDTIATTNTLAFADWDIIGSTPTAGYIPYVAGRDGDTATIDWKDPATLAANQNIWYTLLAEGTATTTPSSPTATIDMLGTANEIAVILTPGGSVATATYTFGLVDDIIIASETIQSTTANSGGGYKRMYAEATSGALAGGAGDIQVNVPTGARILGCQLRIDTAITGPFSWSAAYSGGASQAIVTASAALAKNSKVSTMFDPNADTPIAAGEVDIDLTPIGGDFTGGVVRAIVYYEDLPPMDDNP